MKVFGGFIISLTLLAIISCSENSGPTSKSNDPNPVDALNYAPTQKFELTATGYTNFEFSGFNILVKDQAIENAPSLTNETLDIIEKDLEQILSFNLNDEVKNKLVSVPIFVDYATTNGGARYHPSETWLSEHGLIVEKAQSVEVSNMNNFVDWTRQNQPFMLLHELAHAFHHQEYGYNNPEITDAFYNAISSELYKNVRYHTGGNDYTTKEEAYALNDKKEFFAELSEAYFGRNDYYPFTHDELKEYDPQGYRMIQSVWKQNAQ